MDNCFLENGQPADHESDQLTVPLEQSLTGDSTLLGQLGSVNATLNPLSQGPAPALVQSPCLELQPSYEPSLQSLERGVSYRVRLPPPDPISMTMGLEGQTDLMSVSPELRPGNIGASPIPSSFAGGFVSHSPHLPALAFQEPVHFPSLRHTSCTPSVQDSQVEPRLARTQTALIMSHEAEGSSSMQELAPQSLGSATLDDWSGRRILFTFGVLSIMAHLKPRFMYNYGGPGGARVGVIMTFYGHTVVVEPITDSTESALVTACWRALQHLREFHPQWLVPPMPLDGPTGPEWNWVKLLEEYCADDGQYLPTYRPLYEGGEGWHCDITVNGRNYCTVVPFKSFEQAQNTAAHGALYKLLVGEDVLAHQARAPSGLPSAPAKVDIDAEAESLVPRIQRLTSNPALRRSVVPPGGQNASGGRRPGPKQGAKGKPKSPPSQKISRKKARRAELADQAPTGRQRGTRGGRKARGGKGVPGPPQSPKQNSNLIPLEKHRLTDIETPEKPVDPLLRLKDMQRRLQALGPKVSYPRIMKCLCEFFKTNVPSIRCEKDHGDPRRSAFLVRAWFDDSHPYLSRASPMTLARVPVQDNKSAHNLGVKKVILMLIDIAKEDASPAFSDKVYKRDLGYLKDLERRVEEELHYE